MPAVADIQNSIVKEFENDPRVVTAIVSQADSAPKLTTFWRNVYLRGQMLYDPTGIVGGDYYQQPYGGVPFSRGWVLAPDHSVVLPLFGYDPTLVISTIHELLDALCDDTSQCADGDGDGIRDDACAWWTCAGGLCDGADIVFADMGGPFGACPPDGVVDANDRFHALNCFANNDTDGLPPYPCETDAPQALNVDAGGAFGACCPDGVCDGNDAFHALNAFSGDNPCTCSPATFSCPCPDPTWPPEEPVLCPAGAAAQPADQPARRSQPAATLGLRPSRTTVRGGDLTSVDVILESATDPLRGYQLHLGVSGGRTGELQLVDIAIRSRADHVFAGAAWWEAFNVDTAQMVAGLDGPALETSAPAYLATFTYRASADAQGAFAIDVLQGDPVSDNRSFLFPPPRGPGPRTRPATILLEAATLQR